MKQNKIENSDKQKKIENTDKSGSSVSMLYKKKIKNDTNKRTKKILKN